MRTAWIVLLISAATDFVINAGTSLTAAMVATGSATIPSKAVVILAIIGGTVSLSRTIQQALKATPEFTSALRGTDPASDAARTALKHLKPHHRNPGAGSDGPSSPTSP